jgi:hypothetical protein
MRWAIWLVPVHIYFGFALANAPDKWFPLNLQETVPLKVPKRENFSLAFFALCEPIWVCELGTGEKNRIFYRLTPDFVGFWFFAAYSVCGKPKKNLKIGQN